MYKHKPNMKTSTLFLSLFAGSAVADIHTLFLGSFSGSELNRLEFDDATNDLSLVQNITAPNTSSQKWLALDARKQNLYVAATGYLQSYSIDADLNLTYQTNVSLSSGCANIIHIVVSPSSPYAVFGLTYSTGCAALAVSVDENGTLQSAFANATYDSSAGVHGGAMSPDNKFLYTADDMGNGIWVHSYDSASGTIEEIQHLDATEGSDPRHLTVHPNGNWVYAVYEAASSVAVYSRDNSTGLLTFTNTTYSLLPEGYTNTSSYWADEVLVSSTTTMSPKYLYASTRSRTTNIPGYVAAFALDAETGAITKQLFLLPTTNSGGASNSVGPAEFSEEYFTMPDSGSYFIEIWKMTADASGAEVVAHLDTATPPANAVWYN